jgi:hypothetical protein
MGDGNMLEHGQIDQQQLFPEDVKQEIPNPPELKMTKGATEVTAPQIPFQHARAENPVAPNAKEIERIVVFYTDQTFKEYGPSK